MKMAFTLYKLIEEQHAVVEIVFADVLNNNIYYIKSVCT